MKLGDEIAESLLVLPFIPFIALFLIGIGLAVVFNAVISCFEEAK